MSYPDTYSHLSQCTMPFRTFYCIALGQCLQLMCDSRLREVNLEELAVYAEMIKDCKSNLNVDWLEEQLEKVRYKRRVLEAREEATMLRR